MQIEIITSGLMRDVHQKALLDEYIRRMQWGVTLIEFSPPSSKKLSSDQLKSLERDEYLKRLKKDHYLILLDERGKDMPSEDFAHHLEKLRDNGQMRIQIAIGGADGFHRDILDKADLTLSFGRQTWPHMMVRIMLAEQIYRAQQILAGHPYHRA